MPDFSSLQPVIEEVVGIYQAMPEWGQYVSAATTGFAVLGGAVKVGIWAFGVARKGIALVKDTAKAAWNRTVAFVRPPHSDVLAAALTSLECPLARWNGNVLDCGTLSVRTTADANNIILMANYNKTESLFDALTEKEIKVFKKAANKTINRLKANEVAAKRQLAADSMKAGHVANNYKPYFPINVNHPKG